MTWEVVFIETLSDRAVLAGSGERFPVVLRVAGVAFGRVQCQRLDGTLDQAQRVGRQCGGGGGCEAAPLLRPVLSEDGMNEMGRVAELPADGLGTPDQDLEITRVGVLKCVDRVGDLGVDLRPRGDDHDEPSRIEQPARLSSNGSRWARVLLDDLVEAGRGDLLVPLDLVQAVGARALAFDDVQAVLPLTGASVEGDVQVVVPADDLRDK
ncbi:MAG TPA: hypothetical protein VM347_42405 [Nonomuraea sp.]|nr:hypothetical protein [Nonomuraea sp.]